MFTVSNSWCVPRFFCSVAVLCAAASAAVAGPNIVEDFLPGGDAGSLPGTAAKLFGGGSLNSIGGKLDGGGPGPVGVPDFEDMYEVFIADPAAFSAQLESGPLNPFNTQLWLFDATGLGLLGNDDDAMGGTGSMIGPFSNDATGIVIDTPGRYFIAVTGFDNDPLNAGGPIFNQANPGEISGPDGPGGMQPINDWTGPPAEVGDYTIFLTGVEFIPVPVPTTSTWGLAVMGLLLAVAATLVFARRARILAE